MRTGKTFDDRDGFIWLNGALVPWRSAKVHVLTHALHYASCVFEGQRSYEGNIFKLNEHTNRLLFSAKLLDMKVPFNAEEINNAAYETLRANNILNGYLRPMIWRGSEQMGVTAQEAKINVAITTWVWPSYFRPEARLEGIRLQLSQWRRPPVDCAPVNAKAAGLYMICTLSKHTAERAGYEDALMLDYRGQVADATGANVFFIIKGEIHTPTPDCFLDGITRRTVIELAKKRGYKLIERAIMPEEMSKAQECFLTGTAVEVTPVREVGPYKFTPGEVCRTIMADYDALVGKKAVSSAA